MSFGVTDNMDDYLPPFRWGSLRATPHTDDMEDEESTYEEDYDKMMKAMNSDELNIDDYLDDFIDPMDMDDSDIQR